MSGIGGGGGGGETPGCVWADCFSNWDSREGGGGGGVGGGGGGVCDPQEGLLVVTGGASWFKYERS